MNSDARHVRFQFWLSDHDGSRILYSEWSDGEIQEAEVMWPERIVDLQHWDPVSGTILNHLVAAGWQPGTTPYGIDGDEPVPELQPDHETLPLAAREPVAVKGTPAMVQAPETPSAPTSAPQTPKAPAPQGSKAVHQTAARICIFPAGLTRAKTERTNHTAAGILAGLCLFVLLSAIATCGHSATGTAALSSAPEALTRHFR